VVSIAELDIHVTNRCQLRCRHCCFDAGNHELPELPPSRWFQVLNEAADMGVSDVDFTGGEPLLYNGLIDVIRKSIELGMNTTLQTNGLLLHDSRIVQLLDAGLRHVMISLDGWAESHEWLRGRGTFGLALRAAERALDAGMQVRVNAVAMRSTVSRIPDLIRWAGAEGIPLVSVFAFTGQGRGVCLRREELSYEIWEESLREFSTVADQFPGLKILVEPAMGPLHPTLSKVSCPMLKRGYVQALCDGRAYQCTMLIFSDLFIADLSFESLMVCRSAARWNQLKAYLLHFSKGCPAYDTCKTGELGPDPRVSALQHPRFPLCPLMKRDLRSGALTLRSAEQQGTRTTGHQKEASQS